MKSFEQIAEKLYVVYFTETSKEMRWPNTEEAVLVENWAKSRDLSRNAWVAVAKAAYKEMIEVY